MISRDRSMTKRDRLKCTLSYGEILIFQVCFFSQMSSWNGWSKCRLKSGTCGSGTQSRTRTITVPPYCSANCPTTTDNRDCIHSCCPVHCAMSQWSAWGTCTASCGPGLCTHVLHFFRFLPKFFASEFWFQKGSNFLANFFL